jgi:hypothetical protein
MCWAYSMNGCDEKCTQYFIDKSLKGKVKITQSIKE